MKQEWKDPRIDVQKFIPNEYATSPICAAMNGGKILVRLFVNALTDASSKPYDDTWQGKNLGFWDDRFDFLTHGA